MALNVEQIIEDILDVEGRFSNNPADRGGRTDFGIAERSNPEAWADGKVTREEAKAIYLRKYVLAPGFDKIEDQALAAQLVDFGVNSGPTLAISKLQACLGVEQDGVIGPETLAAIAGREARELNNQLVAERVKMIGRIVVKAKNQIVFLNGWLNRALSFLT